MHLSSLIQAFRANPSPLIATITSGLAQGHGRQGLRAGIVEADNGVYLIFNPLVAQSARIGDV